MSASRDHLVGRLREEGRECVEFFARLTPAQFEQTVYTDGAAWKVRQVLAHITITEESIRRLFENIRAGGPGVAPDFNLNAYNESKVASLEASPPESLVSEFLVRREAMIAFVDSLSAADLERSGRHPFLGLAPLADMIRLVYRHVALHQREIRKALGETPQAGEHAP